MIGTTISSRNMINYAHAFIVVTMGISVLTHCVISNTACNMTVLLLQFLQYPLKPKTMFSQTHFVPIATHTQRGGNAHDITDLIWPYGIMLSPHHLYYPLKAQSIACSCSTVPFSWFVCVWHVVLPTKHDSEDIFYCSTMQSIAPTLYVYPCPLPWQIKREQLMGGKKLCLFTTPPQLQV